MKILRIFMLLTFVLAIGLCSCSSDDDEKKEETLATQILGTWDCISHGIRFTFKNDGKGSSCMIEDEKPSDPLWAMTYNISGNDVNIDIPSVESKYRIRVVTIDAAKMVVEDINIETGEPFPADEPIVFTKITK